MAIIEIAKTAGRGLAVAAAVMGAVALTAAPTSAYADHWHGGDWHGHGDWHGGGHWNGAGIGLGILGGALAGAAIASAPYYYSPYYYGYPYGYYPSTAYYSPYAPYYR